MEPSASGGQVGVVVHEEGDQLPCSSVTNVNNGRARARRGGSRIDEVTVMNTMALVPMYPDDNAHNDPLVTGESSHLSNTPETPSEKKSKSAKAVSAAAHAALALEAYGIRYCSSCKHTQDLNRFDGKRKTCRICLKHHNLYARVQRRSKKAKNFAESAHEGYSEDPSNFADLPPMQWIELDDTPRPRAKRGRPLGWRKTYEDMLVDHTHMPKVIFVAEGLH